MAVIQLKSENEKFSFLIQKNPDSKLFVRDLRKGKLLGWFTDPQTFNCYFKDADDEISYKSHPDEEYEHLNLTRYNSCQFVLNAIDEFFRATYKKEHPDDVSGHKSTLTILMVRIRDIKYLNYFRRHFSSFLIEEELLAKHNYCVKISTTRSVHDLLNFVSLWALFNAIMNDEDIYLSEDILEKYLDMMNKIDSPYFVRYLFKSRFIKSPNLFNKLKTSLEGSSNIEMKFGDNGICRKNELEKLFTFDIPMVDYGCGDGYYAFSWSKKLREGLEYICIDSDPKTLEDIQYKASKKEVENMFFYESFAAFSDILELDEYDVLMTEVFEHNSLKDSLKMVQDLLKNSKVRKLVVTTPNKDFNVHYLIGDGVRREDHLFELNAEEFKTNILTLKGLDKFEVEFIQIGDLVDGVSTTQGVAFTKKK